MTRRSVNAHGSAGPASWHLLLCSGAAAFYLCAAALIEVRGCVLLRGIAHLDVVDHGFGPGGLGHPRRRACVLNHVGASVPVSDTALHAHGEAVLANLGPRQFGSNRGLDLLILLSSCTLRRGRL